MRVYDNIVEKTINYKYNITVDLTRVLNSPILLLHALQITLNKCEEIEENKRLEIMQEAVSKNNSEGIIEVINKYFANVIIDLSVSSTEGNIIEENKDESESESE